MIACLTAGIGIFCSFVWALFAKARARVVELEIRPPDIGPMLRPPGHTLSEQLFVLIEQQDKKTFDAVIAAVIGSVLIFPSLYFLSHLAGSPELLQDSRTGWLVVASIFGLAAAGLCGYRAYTGGQDLLDLKREMHARKLGLRGEQAVAEALHSFEVAGSGYVAFHDVPKPNGGNIDHVVVGPGGVFVIETKARSQQKPQPNNKRNRIKFNGRKTEFPSGGYDSDAPKQCQRNADVVSKWLHGIINDSSVTPLLVYPGWEVHMVERCDDIKAMSANQLRHYFAKLPRRLDEAACSAIRKLFDQKCRDVQI